MAVELRPDMRILFQGDSITDCGRREPRFRPNGFGYVSMVTWWLIARYPELNLQIENRGISGDKVRDLVPRWDEDCIALKPDVLSILVGINDAIHRYTANDIVPIESFEEDYRDILTRVREACDPIIVICEPFLLSHPEGIEVYREDLDPKILVVRQMAREFGAVYVPFDGMFAQASTLQPPSFWAEDGVHPTMPAHQLMARKWMETVFGQVP